MSFFLVLFSVMNLLRVQQKKIQCKLSNRKNRCENSQESSEFEGGSELEIINHLLPCSSSACLDLCEEDRSGFAARWEILDLKETRRVASSGDIEEEEACC
jgi:hypothetical protein